MSAQTSRSVNELLAPVCKAALDAQAECNAAGLIHLITCTYRSPADQDALYAQGRTKPGPKVTNARAGQSFHQWRVALDLYPMIGGKPDFSGTHPNWQKIAAIYKKHGFAWAFEWVKFKEKPHFEMTGGKPLSWFQNGGKL